MSDRTTPAHFAAAWAADTRAPLPRVGDEREILTASLDWHRATFELKCAGLTPEQLSRRSVAASGLSLHGLLRHLAGVERWWFRIQYAGADVPLLYYSDEDPEQDFEQLDGNVDEAFAVWHRECARSREIVAGAAFDDTGRLRTTGEAVSLRRVVVTVLTEYARHDGHADLLRESIDGATGH
ncbi:DUF664 domain-containing protein [Allosaccharopolyspora coralli]|uniref:DUF664 domain-containing protein n=1 Tax=Allosaccharopolyspora coralli TaxID=2665642 RepID=A0A5Q3QD05_9PSEU|nr:DinB family protein [Allosaccharopolyspora coralli]QGK71054.1 DUF664 domain-containing protein [Allosaccharopolyspora coralli]